MTSIAFFAVHIRVHSRESAARLFFKFSSAVLLRETTLDRIFKIHKGSFCELFRFCSVLTSRCIRLEGKLRWFQAAIL